MMTIKTDVPVVFFIFNRPDCTKYTFEAIRRASPKRLHIVADGPRPDRPGDKELCAASRGIVSHCDWGCEVTRDYSDVNLGCGRRVASGVTGAFERFEKAIILEDDCVPDPSFFYYCSELLDRYRDVDRVMSICGDNLQVGQKWNDASYFFSKYFHAWGWATWRRAWKLYDFQMAAWPEFEKSESYRRICPDSLEREHWSKIFSRTKSGEIDTWDYQWILSCWVNGGLVACPRVNLITNIGFGPDAAHCKMVDYRDANLPSQSIGDLIHPAQVVHETAADRWSFEHTHGGAEMRYHRWSNSIQGRITLASKRAARYALRTLGMSRELK